MMLKILKKDKKFPWRVGLLSTKHGGIKTPVFMPIATQGAVKNLTPEELKNLGAQVILSNTYHLWLRPGAAIIKKIGGLHNFMNWDGPILTDSGGFQVFSLASHRQITDEGVQFQDPANGKKYFLTPEKSIQVQFDLGSEIIMVLDDCPGYPASRQEVEESVRRTTSWAVRCKQYFEAQNSKRKRQNRKLKIKTNKPLLFGIIQGSVYKDLRQRSAKEILAIGFDGYAIGGVAVGEPRKYLWQVLDWLVPLLPEDKPRYLMGLGKPEEIVGAVKAGIDMFDCVIPTREARHGRIYKFKIKSEKPNLSGVEGLKAKNQSKDFYETIQITNSKFKNDLKAISEHCDCYTCRNYSRAYLNHLFKIREPIALRLATIHNLRFYFQLMEKLRVLE